MENVLNKHSSILDKYFDESTMSVHFKENVHIIRKKGKPGKWISEVLHESPSKDFLLNIINLLYEELQKNQNNCFLELDKKYSKVLQLGVYRTVIVLPPLSNGLEITVVRPIKKLSMMDYNLPEKIKYLLENKSQGILISGAPGEGKTTFAQALVESYVNQNKIVKTIESPRDLLVPNEVTQYSFSYGSHNEIRDILLLSRPDFTIYDEIRNSDDFILFKDLRLTGIGLVGVIHATSPIDSVQRFIGTIDMGVIPQVIDTVIFIKGGKIHNLFTLKQVVKTPEGMNSDDLSRPVIQIIDFFNDEVKYEIYSFGEQIVVIPMEEVGEKQSQKENGFFKLAKQQIENIIQKHDSGLNFLIKQDGTNDIKLYIDEKDKGKIIGKGGENISKLEKKVGLAIHVKTFDEIPAKDINYEILEKRKGKQRIYCIKFSNDYGGKALQLLIGSHLMTIILDKNSEGELKNEKLIKKIKEHGVKLIDL